MDLKKWDPNYLKVQNKTPPETIWDKAKTILRNAGETISAPSRELDVNDRTGTNIERRRNAEWIEEQSRQYQEQMKYQMDMDARAKNPAPIRDLSTGASFKTLDEWINR